MRQSFLHHATDYFGVAYYGFLAVYAVYDFFVVREHASLLVIGPILYALTIYGILHWLLIPLAAIAGLFAREGGAWDQIKTSFSFGVWSFVLALWIAEVIFEPKEIYSLTQPGSVVLVIIVAIEILLRILLHQYDENNKKLTLLERLKRVDDAYPMGSITILGFFLGLIFFGFLYLPVNRHDFESVLLSGAFIFTVSISLVEWINRRLGKRIRTDEESDQTLSVERKKGQLLFQSEKPRCWSFWITLLAAILSTFIIYNILSFVMSSVVGKRLFTLIFAGIYALLAWIRWHEAHTSSQQGLEASN
jgi:hypothetical protein